MFRYPKCKNPGALAGATGVALKTEVQRSSCRQYSHRRHSSTPSELRQIANAVRRIHDPMRSNPEAVFAAKDQIATRLFRLADAMEAAHG